MTHIMGKWMKNMTLALNDASKTTDDFELRQEDADAIIEALNDNTADAEGFTREAFRQAAETDTATIIQHPVSGKMVNVQKLTDADLGGGGNQIDSFAKKAVKAQLKQRPQREIQDAERPVKQQRRWLEEGTFTEYDPIAYMD